MSVREIQVAGNKLAIHELDNLSDSATGRVITGSWVWDSALVLSDYISTQGRVQFDLRGKTVIELGAGAGLPGMTAALLGASRVVLTDIGSLLTGLKKNVEVNGLGDRVEVREMVWGVDESPSQETDLGEFDLVLMSDVFFDVEEMAELAKTLKRVCGKETVVWAASEARTWTDECLNELASHGFGVIELLSQLGSSSCSSSSSVTSGSDGEFFSVYRLIPPHEGA